MDSEAEVAARAARIGRRRIMVWRVRVEELETIGGAAYRVARASGTIQPDAVYSCFYFIIRTRMENVVIS